MGAEPATPVGSAGAVVGALRSELSREFRDLASIARDALDADTAQRFRALEPLIASSPNRGIILLDAGRASGWAGKTLIGPAATSAGASVLQTPFYTILVFAVESGSRRAEATSVIHAEPPSDRVANVRPLDTELRHPEAIFSFTTVATAGSLPVGFDGRRAILWAATSIGPSEGLRLEHNARLQSKAAFTLLLFTLVLLAAAWRDRRDVALRASALTVAAIAIWIVPWNSFSNYARLFDPGLYFSPLLGHLSSNAGALLFSGILAVLASFAAIRAWRVRPRKSIALLAIPLGVAGTGLVYALSAGIGQPPWGPTPSLWLSWQLPLFLVLFAFVLPSALFLRQVLGAWATIFRSALAAGILAGAVATQVVFSRTVETRMRMAEQDLASLDRPDDYTLGLLRRFANDLAKSGPALDRSTLLRSYASSDLISAGIPVSLTAWRPEGSTLQLHAADIAVDSGALRATIAEASATGQQALRAILGSTGSVLALAVPYPDKSVTTAVVAPRTRLLAVNPQAALLGLPGPPRGAPPYTIEFAAGDSLRPLSGRGARWWRTGEEFHIDRLLPTSAGISRAHAEVNVRSPFARLQRGVLVVLFDLAFVTALWLLAALTERAFPRWARRRVRLWLGTYRARLTLALLLFFTVPALAFAAWSYQRLREDDREMREVLISAPLHRATRSATLALGDSSELASGVSLFRFEDGVLRAVNDDVLEALAPLGAMLEPRIYTRMNRGTEPTAVEERTIGNSRVVVGYRSGDGEGSQFVVGAPARTDETALDRRRRDLGILVLFATALGALAALWLSGIAARTLARDLELSKIEVARAERVIAWGEMARQVAHEIKNPLTPIRLGVQHLRRARANPRLDFDRVLDENVTRILAEIDRLDEIARTFSRYGTAPADLPAPERIDAAAILRDVIALEKLGRSAVSWTLTGADGEMPAMGRGDELRDVLLNVFENARHAGAHNVRVAAMREAGGVLITTDDDGSGVASSILPRVFEPHFSTRTTGSGLGLAVSRRLVESWGGTIELESVEGRGTQVKVKLASADE